MNATDQPAATLAQLQALADLCSEQEWYQLITSGPFLDRAQAPLAELEKFMSERLGRKISVTKPSVKNSGDETL